MRQKTKNDIVYQYPLKVQIDMDIKELKEIQKIG